ncbi:MAG: 16S rRNA (cytidine(1402)-2'-O)-methyltransferase [Dehalococcoidia bacterium]|nr:16S rRNA (cytidine(1402)-2'-O)-methyltransferase [Dehalococcoidia bacterium]
MALYLVATPIGNLEDITLRALRILKEVRLIAAEDTRTTRKLLNHYGIKTPLVSYFEHSGLARLAQILAAAGEGDAALVSEAGMPGLSDPGYEMVAVALDKGIKVVPVPGPTAPVAALVASGLPSDRFLFLGFLPRRAAERRRLLASVARQPYTLVFFEAPHRLLASLSDMSQLLGERRIAVARELTKLYEEVYRGTIREAIQHFAQPRGEFTLVVEGCRELPTSMGEEEVQEALRRALAGGLSRKEAAARVAQETGWSKREVYRLASGFC